HVARHIGSLAVTPSLGWNRIWETDSTEMLMAKLIIVLSRREYDVAYSLLDVVPLDAKPKRALRLAIRRELRNKQNQDARMLLEHYRAIDPEDLWSRRQLKRVKRYNKFLSNHELTTKGFPFPKKAEEAKYVPNRQRV